MARQQTVAQPLASGAAPIGSVPVLQRGNPFDLSVVIPTLNEERNIGALIRAIRRELDSIGLRYELLVIDGGSTDQTTAEVEEAETKWIHQRSPGFGSAVREGMIQAKGDWILLMDADWSHPPSIIRDLWSARVSTATAAAGGSAGGNQSLVDLVIGSRNVGGASSDAPFYRRLLTGLLHLVYAAAFRSGVRDVSSGFRLYRRSALTPLQYQARHFNIQAEVLFKSFSDSNRVVEVPLRYEKRANGESNAGMFRDGLSFLQTLWQIKKDRSNKYRRI